MDANVFVRDKNNVKWFSKSLWGSGHGVILRSLRNSTLD